MANNRYFEVLKRASSFLEAHGKDPAQARYLLLGRLKWSTSEWYLHLREEAPLRVREQLEADLEQVLLDYPPQYLLGTCSFLEREYRVTEATLIPRPETEELVSYVLTQNQTEAPLVVADIGTGSGIIGISLKCARPHWEVLATDISAEAIAVARENAHYHQAEITFKVGDLVAPLANCKLDLLVSNPPYIANSDWGEMDASVRKYEPATALFAAHNGLAMYERLAVESRQIMQPKGKIYLEIGYQQGKDVQAIFQTAYPTKQVTIRKDLAGHDRIVAVE